METRMESKPQHGYLVLGDLSGFTAFMGGTELEHSHEIVGELLELLVERVSPLLTLASLDGGAVPAFAPVGRPHSSSRSSPSSCFPPG